MPLVFQHEARGDFAAAAAVAADAAALAKRFGDTEGQALTLQTQGCMLIKAGRVREGLPLLDEAMATIAGGKVSPIATGIVYCGVILACQEAYEVRRAQEWTAVLTRWCEEQPDLVAFTGRCLVHRAEIMQLRGDWGDALEEARRAGERLGAELQPGRRRPGLLPPGRAPSPARRVRGGGERVPGGEPVRLGAAAGHGAAATRSGAARGRRSDDSARAGRGHATAEAREPAARLRRDHAGRRRRRGSARRLP